MNFVGHAHVALEHGSTPAFVLGSMLPDFASMARARLSPVSHPELAAGVALHHRTDDAFHGAPTFVAFCSKWGAELERRGLSWGASRAVAHVGTEMLLDGFLLDEAPTRSAYLEAAAALGDPALRGAMQVVGAGSARWPAVLERVRTHGAPDFYKDPALVAERLVLVLEGRPRLAVEPAQLPALRDAMRDLRRDVGAAAAALVGSTREALRSSARTVSQT
jgi:acyl carrier protein phosphodiesterase